MWLLLKYVLLHRKILPCYMEQTFFSFKVRILTLLLFLLAHIKAGYEVLIYFKLYLYRTGVLILPVHLTFLVCRGKLL